MDEIFEAPDWVEILNMGASVDETIQAIIQWAYIQSDLTGIPAQEVLRLAQEEYERVHSQRLRLRRGMRWLLDNERRFNR